MMRRLICACGLLSGFALGWTQSSSDNRDDIVWSNYLNGTVCNITESKTTIITSKVAFLAYWKELVGNNRVPNDVDFDREQLVAINLGSRPSSGFIVAVTAIVRAASESYAISYTERRPGSRESVDKLGSAPYTIIRMQRVGQRITFKPTTIDGGRIEIGPKDQPIDNGGVPWTEYMSGTLCKITTAKTTIITNQMEFYAYWKEFVGNNQIPRDVNFDTEQLVAIHLGQRPSGGYQVAVTNIERASGGIHTISYVERRPGSRDQVTNQLSAPYTIIRMRRVGQQITFKPTTIDGGRIDRNPNDQPRNSDTFPWWNYMSGSVCNISVAKTTIISSQMDLYAYWKELVGNNQIPRDVNFDTEQLVAINLGDRPTSGYSVTVSSVDQPRSQDLIITYVERRPGRNDKVDSLRSNPYVIIRIKRFGQRITFKPTTVDGGRVDRDPNDRNDNRGNNDRFTWSNFTAGEGSKIKTPRTTIITSPGQFSSYWRESTGNNSVPNVDFDREQLVAINIGERPTSGYKLSVTSVVQLPNQDVVISYVEQRPSINARVTYVKTSPYVIIRMKKVNSRITFKPTTLD